MNIYVNRSTNDIVGDRSLILIDGSVHDKTDYDPIHIRDLVKMTEEYTNDLKTTLRCNLTRLVDDDCELMNELNTININECDNEEQTLNEVDYQRLLSIKNRGDPLVEYCLLTNTSMVDILTPLTRRQAMSSPQSAQWLLAEQKEIESITQKSVLNEAQLPRGKKPLRTKWVYKLKHGAQGE